jgi:hypothetical protein
MRRCLVETKFTVGDIIEHDDGSIYVVAEVRDTKYVCATILEMDAGTARDLKEGIPYSCDINIATKHWKVIGHAEGCHGQ